MATDREKIEALLFEQLDAIQKDHGDDWEITAVCSILEVRPKGSDSGEVRTRYKGSASNSLGLLRLAQEALIRNALHPLSEDAQDSETSSS